MPQHSALQSDKAEAQRAHFIGRVQEQRQFRVALDDLVAHQRRWRDLAYLQGADFDPDQAPGDDSYARIFLLHGIGGIGKSWLTRRCLALAAELETDAPILTLYDDVSLGAPVLEPAHLMERLYAQLAQAGYADEFAAYQQAGDDLPRLSERVDYYQAENREQWAHCLKLAQKLVPQEIKTHAPTEADLLAKAYDLLLEHMQQAGKLTPTEAELFRRPAQVQAARLVLGLKRLARRRPLVIALDNLEIVVPLEPFLRDELVLPTTQAPILWILSGRYNLADERLVEVEGQTQDYKGYRDFLGENPPVVWDMSIFSDADLAEYLEAEAARRGVTLAIDEPLIDAVKATSSGVPLVVEMVVDALFSMSRDDFLRDFTLDDKSLLPAGRLEQITTRFLRYCLQREDDLERVHALALLRKGADLAALQAVWGLAGRPAAQQALQELHLRYAFVLADGLHDAVYDFVRRQLRTQKQYRDVRTGLGNRAANHYQQVWAAVEKEAAEDPMLRVRDPRWQRAARDLINALLWADPDEAVRFLLPRFVEGLNFDRPFAEGLLLQAEEFLTDAASPIGRSYANLLRQMQVGLKDIGFYDEPGAAVGRMVDRLLHTPDLEPLHLAILNVWLGDWLGQEKRYPEALKAYLAAEKNLPALSGAPPGGGWSRLTRQLGQSFYRLSSIFLWPESALETVPSEPGLKAAQRAVALDPAHSDAWFNLGAALEHLEREDEAVDAYQRAIELEPRPTAYNGLGDVYTALGRYDEAISAYQQANQLNPDWAWPYHNLGLLYEHRGEYEAAIPLYQQALERHQRDKDKAVTWDNLGNVYAALGQSDEAIAAYRWSGVLDSRYASPWHGLGDVFSQLNRDEEAIAAYRQAITLDPAEAWPYNNLALVYERQGNYERAIELYRQALEHHRDDRGRAVTWHNLGDVYRAVGRTDDALAAYQQAIKLDPRHPVYHNSLGDLYALLERDEEAVATYRQAVALNPDYTLAYNSLAGVYSRLGRDEEALAAYQRVIALTPDNAWAYNNLGFIYAKGGQYEAAISCYRQALERHPQTEGQAVSWNNLGSAYEALGQTAEALAAYRRASELAPGYPWPAYHLGRLLKQQGEYEAALAAFQQALEHLADKADQARAWNELGDLYRALEHQPEALEAYQQATELDRTFAPPWNSLGDLYRAQERWGRAESAYRRANQLDPALPWPYHNLALLNARRGDHQAALGLYQQALSRHHLPAEQTISWNRLGESYRALERLEEAGQAYRQALALDPIYPWPYHNLGLLAEQQGDLERAAAFFRQALDRHQRDSDRAAAWTHLGHVYRRQEQLHKAIDAYRRAAELDPTYAEPWGYLGDVLRTLEQAKEAISAYRKAIGLNPAEPWPYHHLAWLYQQQGRYEEALTRYQQAIERHRTEADQALSWQQIGQLHVARGQEQEGLEAFVHATLLDPTYALPWHSLGDIYRQQNSPTEAISAYRKAAQRDPGYAATWWHLGNLYREQGRPDEAIQAYQRAIALEPGHAWAYHHLGSIYEARREYQAALTYYRQAVQRHTGDHDRALAWNSLGDVYRALNQPDQALAAYQQAIQFDPSYAWPYHHAGAIYEQRGQYESALSHYQQAIAHHPQDQEQAELWDRLGAIYYRLGRDEAAAQAYLRVTELVSGQAAAWNSLGTVYRRLERLDEAVDAFKQAIALDASLPWPFHNLALIYEQQGRDEPALNRYQQAVERHPQPADQARAWEHIGLIQARLQQPEEAVAAYQQAAKLDPTYALPWSHLGDVYLSQGRTTEAVAAYQQATRLDPSYPWPYHHLGLIYSEQAAYDPAVANLRQAVERHQRDQDKALAWYGIGQVYQALPNVRAALEAYQQAAALDPTYPWSYHQLGLLHEGQQDYAEAQKFYRQALEWHAQDDPRRAASWQHLGNTAVALGDLEGAVEAYQRAAAADPQDAVSRNNLGDVLAILGRYPEALTAYRQAAELDPAYVAPQSGLGNVYVKMGRHAEAAAAYRRAINLAPETAWFHRNLALVYEQQGNYEAALEAYQQAINRYPAGQPGRDQAAIWYYVGNAYRTLRRYDEAITAYQRAIELDPQYALPWNSLGSIFNTQEREAEAVAAYTRAIQLDPTYAWPYHNLGLIAEKQAKYPEAIKLYEEAIVRHQEEKDQATSWHRLGHVYETLGQSERAIVVDRRASELDPASALPWNSLGDIYSDLEQLEAAVAAYQQAIKLEPDYAWPYNNLGLIYEKLGQYDQAISLYRRVIERQPGSLDQAISWNNLGNVYTALNRTEEAIAAYQQAIELDPTYTWPYHNLGAIYEKQGQSEMALAFYQQATRQHKQRVAVV